MSLPASSEINTTNFSFLVIFPPKRACLNTCRFAGVDSDKTETLERTDLNKTEQAVVKKTRTAREMKARTVQSRRISTPGSFPHLSALQELAKSLRRSSGGGGVLKAAAEDEMSSPDASPTRVQRGDGDDADSIVFMEQGRQVYDSSRARVKVAAAKSEEGDGSKARPSTGKSGSVRPRSA